MYSEQCYKLGSNRSAIRELFEYGKQRAAIVGKENVYDFSLGNPTIPAPACVKEAIVEILETTSSMEVHGYTSAQGDAELRAALAEYYNNTYGTKFHADNYYITCGAAASLCISFRALTESKEDEFIAIAPFFPEYRVFVEGNGAKLRVVKPETENFQINMKELEAAINEHTKGVIINSPNNPSGVVYSEETIKELAALLTMKSKELGHTIFLISDEPYREIVYDDVEVPYVTKYYANTIVCYSYSKSLSLPGERIGFVLVPDEVTDSRNVYYAMCGAARALGFVCAPSMFQKVLIKCLGQVGDISLYKTNRDILYKGLTELGFECVKPEGAFYLWMKSPVANEEEFVAAGKKYHILMVKGSAFGCAGYVRLAYCVSYEMIERSLSAFEKLAKDYNLS